MTTLTTFACSACRRVKGGQPRPSLDEERQHHPTENAPTELKHLGKHTRFVQKTPYNVDEVRPSHIATAEPARQIAAGQPAGGCLLYTSPSPRDRTRSRMPSSA